MKRNQSTPVGPADAALSNGLLKWGPEEQDQAQREGERQRHPVPIAEAHLELQRHGADKGTRDLPTKRNQAGHRLFELDRLRLFFDC